MTIWLLQISHRLHLDTSTQQFKYEFTLEPYDHMIIKNLPSIEPRYVDSTMQIRIYFRNTWPYDYYKSPLHLT